MKVSVLMPVYNGAQYLQKAIDSILDQTYKDFEFIIVDDGSTDNSAAIIARNAAKDKRIVFMQNERNSGICVTLNNGLERAKGEYIVRMDCDDISLPERIARQVEFMDKHPKVGASGSNILLFGDGLADKEFDFGLSPLACKADMLFSSCMAHPATIIRKKALQQLDVCYDEYYKGMEDFDLWWRLSLISDICNIPERLLKYRIHAKQETQKEPNEPFKLKIRQLLEFRLSCLNLKLSEEDILMLFKYLEQGATFNDKDLKCFISTCQRLLKQLKRKNKPLYSNMAFVIARAISSIIDNSNNPINQSSFTYHNLSLIKGCFPFSWYVKRVGNEIRKRIRIK